MLPCEKYALTVLIVTALWVYLGRNWNIRTLALAMFFPGLFAIIFNHRSLLQFAAAVIGIDKGVWKPMYYSVIGGLIAAAVVIGCVVISILLGWGYVDEQDRLDGSMAEDLLSGIVYAAGEEVGWRCYLLPCLLNDYTPAWAFIISGVVWGLYHVPIMILLTQKLKVMRPWTTVFVQFLASLVCTYIHGWVAIKSGFSLWAPTMMHFAFNRINPPILGSMYTQGLGKVRGTPLLINAEGVAGVLVMAPMACLVLQNINAMYI